MKTALKNNFEKTLSALLFIVMCMYARQTYAQMVNMTPYDSPVPDSLRLAPDGRMTKLFTISMPWFIPSVKYIRTCMRCAIRASS